jgi:hypothetical protein
MRLQFAAEPEPATAVHPDKAKVTSEL